MRNVFAVGKESAVELLEFLRLPHSLPTYPALRIEVVQVIIYEHAGRQPIRQIKFVRYVPSQRAELPSFLNDGVQERDGVY